MRDSSLSWKKKLGQGFLSAAELLDFLELPAPGVVNAEQQFPSRIPLSFAQRMQKGNPRDPLLLQVLATIQEEEYVAGYSVDPLSELHANPIKGLIHKYHGRVLLTLTGVCAINCRYCFRRHFPYQDNNPGSAGRQTIIDYISADKSIHEVILSGGDPLLASNHVLKDWFTALSAISHVRTVRIHTRIPIVFPERIDADLLAILADLSLNKVMVLHCNHAQELNDEVGEVCQQLKQTGLHLLNQSVLLAGVNDEVHTLVELSHALFQRHIVPYYLHVLDKVHGAAHFDVPLEEAKGLHQQMQTLLPGYLVPRLAREDAGALSKTLIF